MSARERILGDVRRALGRGELSEQAKAGLETRLKSGKANLIPARSDKPHDAQVDLFAEMAEGVQASVARVPDGSDVPGAVADYLAQNNLPSDIVMAPDENLDAYPWAERPLLRMRRGKAEGADQVSITAAEMAFAETGTLMLTSDAARPSTLNFLPENHIVVLRAEQITGAYEEGWKRLRSQDANMPRTVNLITGPSRTGDIEQTIQLGAHGPRRLHIIIVEG
ncbi:MAG: lactate utilization protein [Rhodospirillaceae bacterium]|nr:lactate utilization protein [Rhodospirillaceae bacterium]MBT5040584.1 lactate utilization protein [Rhodospirillaceae bacterium]